MRIALIADTFPPLRTSGAVQLRDLTREFIAQGHDLTVLLPDAEVSGAYAHEDYRGADVIRLKAPRTKDMGYVRRTLAEFSMPFAMRRSLAKSPFAARQWDGVIWYSPSIFHGPLVKAVKRASACKSYLIIRDIFPEWAVDMGLMKRGLAYRMLDAVARFQYSVADVIGVQTPGNLGYFDEWKRQHPARQLEILPNWLGASGSAQCPIDLSQTSKGKRRYLVYAGNMGVAQNMDIILDMAQLLLDDESIGIVLVGRGSERERLEQRVERDKLANVAFYDEIDPDAIPALYTQCDIGLVTLDPRHKSHNIPGKFLTYMQSGLPVLACVNEGNDMAQMIRDKGVGQVLESDDAEQFTALAKALLAQLDDEDDIEERCKALFAQEFAVKSTVAAIVSHFAEGHATA